MKVTIAIPEGASVFLLEDSPERVEWFTHKIPDLVTADTADKAIAILAGKVFDFVFLDHDLGLMDYAGGTGSMGNGQEVAHYLSGRGFLGKNVFIHSWNALGAAKMKDILEGAYAVPFGQFDIRRT